MDSFLRIWTISLIVRLGLAALLPFFSDEAYYWVWSNNLQLSYFDHPPAVAWLFWLGKPFEYFGQASRWPAILLSHGTIWIWFQILKPLLETRALQVWLWLVLLNPLLGPGSLVITPDVPLMFFWTTAIWSLLRLTNIQTLFNYALFGAVLGLGFCSKYHMVLFVPFAFIAFGKQLLPVVKKPQGLALTLLCGIIFSSPVWVWNLRHDWASFRFQLNHGLGGASWQPSWTLLYLAGQVGLVFPSIVLLIWTQRKRIQTPSWLLRLGLLPIGFFLFTSFKGHVEANWPLVGYPALMATAAAVAHHKPKWIAGTLALWGTLIMLAISLVFHNWLPVEPSKLKTSEHLTYEKLAPVARSYTPFFASSYQMAAYLSYKLRTPIYKVRGIGRKDFYDFVPESQPSANNIFICLDRWDRLPPDLSGYSEVNTTDIDGRFRLVELARK